MRYRRAEHVSWDVADDRVVVLDAPSSSLTTLNPVGSILWQHLDEPRSADELAVTLEQRFAEVGREQLGRDVEEFVAELVREGLLLAETGPS